MKLKFYKCMAVNLDTAQIYTEYKMTFLWKIKGCTLQVKKTK